MSRLTQPCPDTVPRIKTQCRKKFADWRDPEVVYIGANQWAFSATKPHDIVFSCPPNVGQPPLRTVTLPVVRIFEVPLVCTARTEDWVFPASMEGSIEAPNLQAAVLPSVNVFSQDPTSNSSGKHAINEIPRENTSSIDIICELLQRNDHASARLAAHKQHDVVSLPPEDRGREELEMQNLNTGSQSTKEKIIRLQITYSPPRGSKLPARPSGLPAEPPPWRTKLLDGSRNVVGLDDKHPHLAPATTEV
ncbi:hypothetical protein OUZ56_003128 [Daphnia magna]|uniref:Uncharacterized protein n=1 Tax=Daphnia magna TaxID=35525 RepID=A0ABR0A841_9CRUS|nr:hypothetical protein OUZ56_003128 [Daphnia magna]